MFLPRARQARNDHDLCRDLILLNVIAGTGKLFDFPLIPTMRTQSLLEQMLADEFGEMSLSA